MKTKKRKRSIQVAMLISLTLLLMSCVAKPTVKPVDIDLDFPVFPDPTNNAVMMDVGTQFLPAGENKVYESTVPLVVMPLDYWLLITEYKIEVDRVEEIYKAVK